MFTCTDFELDMLNETDVTCRCLRHPIPHTTNSCMQNTLSTPKVKDATVMNQNSGTGSMYYEDSWVKEDVLYPDLFTFITDGNLN